MRSAGTYRVGWVGAFFICAAASACSYDFDSLVAETGGGGSGGGASGGAGGLAGQGGSSGAAGSADDGGGSGGTAGAAGTGGAAGNAGASGTGGSSVDGGKGGTSVDGGKGDTGVEGGRGDGPADSGKGGDAAIDRRSDAVDVRPEPSFDCATVSGIVFQGHCYYPSPTPTSWDAANMTACAAPAHLAVITTAAEQDVVAAILPGIERWIGFRKDPGPPNQEARFYWVTKEPVGFKIWESYDTGASEPNFTGDCVRMQPSTAWGDDVCTEQKAAVCEFE